MSTRVRPIATLPAEAKVSFIPNGKNLVPLKWRSCRHDDGGRWEHWSRPEPFAHFSWLTVMYETESAWKRSMNLSEVWTNRRVVLSNTPLLFVYIQAGKSVSLRPRPELVPSNKVDSVWNNLVPDSPHFCLVSYLHVWILRPFQNFACILLKYLSTWESCKFTSSLVQTNQNKLNKTPGIFFFFFLVGWSSVEPPSLQTGTT